MTSRASTSRLFPPRTARTLDKAHGRIEIRFLEASEALNGYLAFPHVGQVFRLTRTVTRQNTGEASREVAHGVTSLSSEAASPVRLLSLVRDHWGIESRHWIRDATFGEDRSAVRTRFAPQNMATLRNLTIGLIALKEKTRKTLRDIPVVMRRLARFPEEALALLNL